MLRQTLCLVSYIVLAIGIVYPSSIFLFYDAGDLNYKEMPKFLIKALIGREAYTWIGRAYLNRGAQHFTTIFEGVEYLMVWA